MINTTPLGSTGHQVTRFGMEMAALGRPGYVNLAHAPDPIIRNFNTARPHGGLAEIKPGGVTVGLSTSGPSQAAVIRNASPIEWPIHLGCRRVGRRPW